MKKISALKLWLHFISLHFRSAMQYKTSFVLTMLGQFLSSFTAYLGIHYMFLRFDSVRGYSFEETLLCFATILTAFSLAECFARGLDTFPSVISNGEFDRILVRPRSELFMVMTSKFEFTRIGRLAYAVMVFVFALSSGATELTPMRVLCLTLMIICATIVFSGVFTIYAFICFFTTEGLEFMNILTDGVREYGKYPFEIYGREILLVLTFVVPYALVQYYPFLYLIGRSDDVRLAFLPLLSLLFLIPCAILWRLGVKHYKSTGS